MYLRITCHTEKTTLNSVRLTHLLIVAAERLLSRELIDLHALVSPRTLSSQYEQASSAAIHGFRVGRSHWGTRKISEALAVQHDHAPYFWVDTERVIEQIYHEDLELREVLLFIFQGLDQ